MYTQCPTCHLMLRVERTPDGYCTICREMSPEERERFARKQARFLHQGCALCNTAVPVGV